MERLYWQLSGAWGEGAAERSQCDLRREFSSARPIATTAPRDFQRIRCVEYSNGCSGVLATTQCRTPGIRCGRDTQAAINGAAELAVRHLELVFRHPSQADQAISKKAKRPEFRDGGALHSCSSTS